MQTIKEKVINILDLKEKDNLYIVCELYKIFNELSIECFSDDKDKQILCYDQLCIILDSINDNMHKVDLVQKLTCIIYDSGLCDIEYE